MSENKPFPVRYKSDFKKDDRIEYDSIVDKSDFKIGQDRERNIRLSGDTGGSLTNGLYDFNSDKDIETKSPSDLTLSLRNGKLDKADIDTLHRVQTERALNEAEENEKKKASDKEKAIESARQDFIDSQTGFDKGSVN